mmetsp:Transcript_31749/g.47998  ORF Transcript_31749/g.47998 Transcript_31749/m.47998 type:complete len:80 (+) Transcript_31749:333-572(+)
MIFILSSGGDIIYGQPAVPAIRFGNNVEDGFILRKFDPKERFSNKKERFRFSDKMDQRAFQKSWHKSLVLIRKSPKLRE